MRPFVALSFVLAMACGAPQWPAAGYAGLGGLGLGYGAGLALPAAGVVAGATQSVGPAPAGHGLVAGEIVPLPQAPYVAPPVPAPYTTATQGAGVTTVHQPAPVVTKQVHLGQTSYVSGYNTRILKPATPHLPIAVPTVLKGSVAYNPAIITEQTEIHNVQTPVLVERKVPIPYDAPVYKDNIVSVPHPVHIDAPYNVPVPVAVAGEPIIKKSVAPAVVTHSNHVAHAGVTSQVQAAPIVNAAAYAAAPFAAAPLY